MLAALFILTDAAIFRGRYIVTTNVPDAGGIRRGDPVQMRGVNIGRVQRFKIDPEGVAIRLEIEGEYDVPADSQVLLKSSGLLGGMIAEIVPGKSTEPLRNGGTLPGKTDEAMMDVVNRLTGEAEEVARSACRPSSPTRTWRASATRRATSTRAAAQMRKLLADVNVAVNDQRRELRALSASLQRSAEGFEKVATGPELERTLKQVDAATARMDTVMASLERTSATVESVMGRMDRGEGTPGQAHARRGALPQHERGDAQHEPGHGEHQQAVRGGAARSEEVPEAVGVLERSAGPDGHGHEDVDVDAGRRAERCDRYDIRRRSVHVHVAVLVPACPCLITPRVRAITASIHSPVLFSTFSFPPR